MRIYASMYILMDFNLVVTKLDYQTTKFNSPPHFLSMQYTFVSHCSNAYQPYPLLAIMFSVYANTCTCMQRLSTKLAIGLITDPTGAHS